MPWLLYNSQNESGQQAYIRSIVSIPTTDATLVSTGSGSMSKSCKWGHTKLWCSQILCRIRIIAAAWHSRTFPGLGLPLDLNQPKNRKSGFQTRVQLHTLCSGHEKDWNCTLFDLTTSGRTVKKCPFSTSSCNRGKQKVTAGRKRYPYKEIAMHY